MCGIIYVKRGDNKPARKQILKRYKKQQSRGSDGFGYVALAKNGQIVAYHRFQEEKDMETALSTQESKHILFHHRFPTSTPNLMESAHPIKVAHKELEYDYYVVHNGVISNDDELRAKHLALGYRYNTEVTPKWETTLATYSGATQWNDSESLAIELARSIEYKTPKCEARGAIAYIVLQVDKQTQKARALYYGTNGGNPLTIWQDAETGNMCIASEGGKKIIADTCYRIDLKTNQTTIAAQVIMQSYLSASAYGTYGYNSGGDYTYSGSRASEYDFTAWDGEELESEISELEMQLEEVAEALKEAITMGDLETESELLDTQRELKDSLKKVQRAYESSASARMPF